MTEHTDTETLAWGDMPYDGYNPRMVIDDYVLVRGDLVAEYAREQLAAWIDRYAAARVDAARRDALTEAADAIEATRSQKGIASRALDPGKAYAADVLRARAAALGGSDPTQPEERRPCPDCGPGYHYGDDGCRHGITWADATPPLLQPIIRKSVGRDTVAMDSLDDEEQP